MKKSLTENCTEGIIINKDGFVSIDTSGKWFKARLKELGEKYKDFKLDRRKR